MYLVKGVRSLKRRTPSEALTQITSREGTAETLKLAISADGPDQRSKIARAPAGSTVAKERRSKMIWKMRLCLRALAVDAVTTCYMFNFYCTLAKR